MDRRRIKHPFYFIIVAGEPSTGMSTDIIRERVQHLASAKNGKKMKMKRPVNQLELAKGHRRERRENETISMCDSC